MQVTVFWSSLLVPHFLSFLSFKVAASWRSVPWRDLQKVFGWQTREGSSVPTQVLWEDLGWAEAARGRWGHGRSLEIQEEIGIWERGSSSRKQMFTVAVNNTE